MVLDTSPEIMQHTAGIRTNYNYAFNFGVIIVVVSVAAAVVVVVDKAVIRQD